MSILLIGCGYWGQNWARVLNNINELGAICESASIVQQRMASQYPGTPLYDTVSDALRHPGIDAVVVATPVSTHYAIARRCLQAGKSVLVEKPLTMDPQEAEALLGMARQSGVTLAVGHLLMHQPALLKLRDLMRDGVLGDILSVQCTRINLGKVRNEENVWWSLAPHDLSIISLLLEEPFYPTSASQMTPLGRPEIPDSVYAAFETPSGKSASVYVSWLAPFKQHKTVVIGSKKIAVFEDTLPPGQKLQLLEYQLERQGNTIDTVQRGQIITVPYETPDEDLLTLQARAFMNAVRKGQPLQNDGENGLQVTSLLAGVENLLSKQTAVPSFQALTSVPDAAVL